MRYIDIYPQGSMQVIPLGRRGEDKERTIVFHTGGWANGTATLLVKRKGDSNPYPPALTATENFVYWEVTATDTAVAGGGTAELRLTLADGTVDKVQRFFTQVEESQGGEIGPQGPEGPAGTAPEPVVIGFAEADWSGSGPYLITRTSDRETFTSTVYQLVSGVYQSNTWAAAGVSVYYSTGAIVLSSPAKFSGRAVIN